MRKIIKVISCLMICVLLFGCSGNILDASITFNSKPDAEIESTSKVLISSDLTVPNEAESEASSAEVKSKKATDKESTASSTTATTKPSEGTTVPVGTTSANSTTKPTKNNQPSNSNKQTSNSKSQNSSQPKPSNKPNNKPSDNVTQAQSKTQATTGQSANLTVTNAKPVKSTNPKPKPNPTEPKALTCSVEIECSAILSNMGSLKAGHESYVPSNGVILSTYNVTVPSGATAYDALKKACDNNNIKLTVQSTMYGTYVSGINNLDEKDCGPYSGWLYFVNGTKPSYSASSYKLNNGDKVVFSYTCTY